MVLVPLVYWALVLAGGLVDRDQFLLGALAVAALGAVVLLVWKVASGGELWFQVGSFMFNAVFLAYFISLATR